MHKYNTCLKLFTACSVDILTEKEVKTTEI